MPQAVMPGSVFFLFVATGVGASEILKKDLEAAEIFLAGFNVKIAPRLGTEPITPFELAEYIHIAGPKEAEIIATLARAKAELAFGNRLAACPLIAETIRLTEHSRRTPRSPRQ